MDSSDRAVAIVGLGAILPDAPDVATFWQNLLAKRYSIREVPPDRWRASDYYDPDPAAPDKTYSQIGGWVRGFAFDWKQHRLPPRVAAAMDEGQQWAVAVAAQALADYDSPTRPLDTERVAVVLGTAMGGELHYKTHERIAFPEFAHALEGVRAFGQLPATERAAILDGWRAAVDRAHPPITEDSMPGELPNIVSGRVANLLNLRGPNFITDAACASALAAVNAAIELLVQGDVDAVITGGVDRNMGVSPFVKFSKIGALSATGSRPFGEGADGFVMGEGAAAFLLKRLADAERDGDRIYAVIRGVGGASDGRGKGITAPNPAGQQLAVRRAWDNAGLDPASATLVEAHGTSTRVGDVVEVESLAAVFGSAPRASIGLGSVKGNIGHLKAAAGAAGLLKAVLALHHRTLPPTLNGQPPNPNIDFDRTPFYLLHETRAWDTPDGAPRRCGVSAYGFGGTNFHVVLEVHRLGQLTAKRPAARHASEPKIIPSMVAQAADAPASNRPAPLRGLLALGDATKAGLVRQTVAALERARQGWAPAPALPEPAVSGAAERLVIDFGNPQELTERLEKARKALDPDTPPVWKALQPQGIFRGSGPPAGKVAFLFPGQGSQYLNMGRELRECSPQVAAVLAEADAVMAPILGRPLTSFLFVEAQDPAAVAAAEQALTQTAVTQPAMLALDIALLRLLQGYGFEPDMVMGHSLGEYAALIAAGAMPFADALEAAAARGAEMTRVSVADNGWMAAVMAPYAAVEATLKAMDGYVVAANLNSPNQCVIGGASAAVEQAMQAFRAQGYEARRLPVSHAFHTQIVAPASGPLRRVLDRLRFGPPHLPLVANVTGNFYPTTPEAIKDLLQQQIASPVQWVKGLETLYAAGARVFVEVGPKKALKGLVDDVLGAQPGVVALFTNHPKTGELASFNQAVCGLYAAGLAPCAEARLTRATAGASSLPPEVHTMTDPRKPLATASNGAEAHPPSDLGEQLLALLQATTRVRPGGNDRPVFDRHAPPAGSVVISGTGLGLPGAEKHVMDPDNAQRILRGEQFVDLLPERFRKRMLDKSVTRLVKSEDGSGRFERIVDPEDVIKLAGRPGAFDLTEEYGVPAKLVEALDITSQLALAAGLDALREAGLPLVQTYRRTTTGRNLPDRWLLPEPLRDETGVIFASAFPGGDRFASELVHYYTWRNRLEQAAMLEALREHVQEAAALREIDGRLADLREQMAREPYEFDRRFLFRVLSMGHSQFAEYIGARGPNTQVNAACASTTQAIALAEDWIRDGRCRRVIVIAADDVTGDNMMEWVGAGFLATGAVATDDRVDEAALPFDRRRHGTLMGMGACALVLECEDALRERGMRGIVELLASEVNNSAFHATRLDVDHIAQVMDALLVSAERRFGLQRHLIAPQLVFMSHETFTPARGGSASAEVVALRRAFGEGASDVVVANTKGFTGHPMGVGIEDVIAVKILEHGRVPPVPNFKEVDPELGRLNLSRGGRYPVQFALHLAAGFGSQIAMTLTRRIPGKPDRVDEPLRYRRWLADVSGQDQADLAVVKRVLRVAAGSGPGRPPQPSPWRAGTGPSLRARTADISAARSVAAPPTAQAAAMGRAPSVEQVRVPPAEHLAVEQQPALTTVATPATPVTVEKPLASPAVTPVAAPTAIPEQDTVAEAVLQLVAEKTGYPRDMLELDLDLEADLGIDTVKQAETFAAIRAGFDLPRQENLRLRDYPTLKHVIDFVRSQRPQPLTETGDAVPAAPEAAPAPPQADDVAERVLAIVAEKTGYPRDMLEMDLDLEADLGIDTVKQAETFATIRAAFDIPRLENLRLRDYPTLQHVIGFVRQMKPAPEGKAETAPNAEAAPAGDDEAAQPRPAHPPPRPEPANLDDADRVPRRIPVPALRPPLALCKPTGAKLEAGTRVIVMADEAGVGPALSQALRQRGVSLLWLAGPQAPAALDAQVAAWLASGPVDGVYWLKALEAEPALDGMDLDTWRACTQQRVKNLYRAMRALVQASDRANGAAPRPFLVTATRLGGLHGYGPEGTAVPLGGAVTGFAKAYKREQPLTMVKAVDFDLPAGKPPSWAALAETLIAETLTDPGVVEIGYRCGDRFAPTLIDAPLTPDGTGLPLGPESVFLVTGAAGGITSAIVTDLAAASAGTFYLLDLTPLPDKGDARIALFCTDKEALKQRLIADARAAGERPTPAAIDRQLLAVERQEAALRAVEMVRRAGGAAHYRSVNLLDAAAVAATLDEIRERHGRVDVLIHAAGLEISRTLAEKDPAQFDLVFDVKADGYFNLLRAAAGVPIGVVVAFSSVAGRFGNAGQTDYAAANDLLCKLTSSLRAWRPGTRGLAIDWTAWDGIGMATRGSIPRLMEMAGIELLPPAAGVPTVRRELTRSGFSGEVVVAGRLGRLLDEWDATGGLDLERAQQHAQSTPCVMIGKLKAARLYGGWEAETVLDPAAQPFLRDHAHDGTPLLPGVMGVEAFAQLASLAAPGWVVQGARKVRFERPLKFYRGQPRAITLTLSVLRDADGSLRASGSLRSTLQPAKRELPAREQVHFTGEVQLGRQAPTVEAVARPELHTGAVLDQAAIYARFFHGPAYQVLAQAHVAPDRATGLWQQPLPEDTVPAGGANCLAPRLIELCFQSAGLWELEVKRRLALPRALGAVTVYPAARRPADGPLYALVRPVGDGDRFEGCVVDEQGQVYVAFSDYQTIAVAADEPTASEAGAAAG